MLLTMVLLILDTDVVEDGGDSPEEAITGVHVSNCVSLLINTKLLTKYKIIACQTLYIYYNNYLTKYNTMATFLVRMLRRV